MSEPVHENDGSKAPAHRGQFVVLGMLAVAVAAASFAWWWNFQRGRRALEFYGPEAATLIRTAPKVEIVRSPSDDNLDISHVPGLINARTSLLDDASYRWYMKTQAPPRDAPGVQFTDGDRSVVVRFSFSSQSLETSPRKGIVKLAPKTANGWKTFLERQLGSPIVQP